MAQLPKLTGVLMLTYALVAPGLAIIIRSPELLAQDQLSESEPAPVTLDQDSMGRLFRIDAMQVQAIALAPPNPQAMPELSGNRQ